MRRRRRAVLRSAPDTHSLLLFDGVRAGDLSTWRPPTSLGISRSRRSRQQSRLFLPTRGRPMPERPLHQLGRPACFLRSLAFSSGRPGSMRVGERQPVFCSVGKRRRRAIPAITSTFDKVSDTDGMLETSPRSSSMPGVRSKRSARHNPGQSGLRAAQALASD